MAQKNEKERDKLGLSSLMHGHSCVFIIHEHYESWHL